MPFFFFVVLTGCQSDSLPGGSDASAYQGVVKFYLVTGSSDDDKTKVSVDIYEIDDPDQVRTVGRWAQTHINRSIDSSQGERAYIVERTWHPELLAYGEGGEAAWAHDLGDEDIINTSDHGTISEWFRKHGKRVDTVPGRKPPKQHVPFCTSVYLEKEAESEPSLSTTYQAGTPTSGSNEQERGASSAPEPQASAPSPTNPKEPAGGNEAATERSHP